MLKKIITWSINKLDFTPQRFFKTEVIKKVLVVKLCCIGDIVQTTPALKALKAAGKYHRTGETGHVWLAGFDGDATAYRLLTEGYLDATGVQDVYFEARQTVEAVLDLRAGKSLPGTILDPGFVISQANLQERAPRMWGAQVKKAP